MERRPIWTATLLVCFLALSWTGCDRNGNGTVSLPPEGNGARRVVDEGSGSQVVQRGGADVSVQNQLPDDVPPPVEPNGDTRDEAPPAEMPLVLMSQADEATCLLKVGELVPAADVTDLEGRTQPLAELYGEKLTILCFWTLREAAHEREELRTRGILEDLSFQFAEPFKDQGVGVVAVHVGGAPDNVRPQVDEAGVTYPVVLDAEGALFGELATERLPRVYLVDAGGKILWFDIEFSRSTRRDLMQAVRYSLAQ